MRALEIAMKLSNRSVVIMLLSLCLPTAMSSGQTFGTNPKPHFVCALDLFVTFQVVLTLLP